ERDALARHDDVDGAVRGLTRRLDFAAQRGQLAVDESCAQGADHDRQDEQISGFPHGPPFSQDPPAISRVSADTKTERPQSPLPPAPPAPTPAPPPARNPASRYDPCTRSDIGALRPAYPSPAACAPSPFARRALRPPRAGPPRRAMRYRTSAPAPSFPWRHGE